ncbi:EAL domain-containing protein [Vibrio vulnificus]|uniref:EAL domain-containing protein n=1 Tax=Vibrio vulnificus TaxID=672 RepID=UPI0030EE709A
MSNNFYMVYQPLFQNDRIVAVEALLRPVDRSLSIISFIGSHISTLQLDKDVIQAVISDVQSHSYIKEVHINVHPSSLNHYDFIHLCVMLRMKTSTRIVLEIVEYESYQFDSLTFFYMRYLRTFGIQIAIDDFGQQFSNSESLVHVPVDKVKIDGALIKGIESKKLKLKLLNHINSMIVDLLDALVVFEQVENIKQFELIKLINPNAIIQGYYLEKPMKLSELKIKYKNKFSETVILGVEREVEELYEHVFNFMSNNISSERSIYSSELNCFIKNNDVNKLIYDDDVAITIGNLAKRFFKKSDF